MFATKTCRVVYRSPRSNIYWLLVVRFMMNGSIAAAGVFCCVVQLMTFTHIEGAKCPAIETGKGPSIPVFTKKSSSEDQMEYAPLQRFTLKCCVRGQPKPNITWLKDNKPLLLPYRLELRNDNQELFFRQVSIEDSGKYTCIAQNINGSSNYTIIMDIREWRHNLDPPQLKITTPGKAVVGSNITLQCQVTSRAYRPIVWWEKLNGTTPTILPSYVTISNKIIGEYLSTLTITNVSYDDAGIYKCRAKNGAVAIQEKSVNLTVIDKEQAPTKSAKMMLPEKTFSQKYLALVVGGGLALLALILSVMTVVYVKKHKPEGWVTRKLIQMGVVKPANCLAERHGEHGDDECICVVTWDVFISYNNKDREWVMNVLHEELKYAYKVCIDYQNFVPGGGVVDNIARCIWRSKTTLFVVSRDFLESGWSKLEFEITQDKIRQSQGSLIVIMLEDIKWQELPPILRRYTTGKMHVDCKDKQFQPKAWRRLKSLLGPSITLKEDADVKELPMAVPCEEDCILIMETSL